MITIRQLKELNERLYSENFIYRDIKEKVIGKTCNYYPEIKENLVELISGILVSAGGMNYKEYAKAVDNIRKTNSVIEFYPNDIVFAPSEVEKDKLVCVTGISPSNRLYPADDLFLYRAKELYADLDLVDELDVFGMSPFGDESIIEKINEKNLIRIFVYNKNENDETKVWESKLKCKYELLESDDMK